MKINFNKIILHNFLSFNHVEVDLQNKDACIVKGINKNPKDNAISNGSGKSSLWSGIIWALTGETITGITNVKNIFIDENLCYVELDFSIDADSYKVIRYKEPKSDMKIYQNNVEISGKGIRESEQVLAKYIADLNRELLTSVIILGQGLPDKLSSKSPSGRKELLEHLSKSDFMIEDIKIRLAERSKQLSTENQTVNNALLKLNTELAFYQKELAEKSAITFDAIDYDQLINELDSKIKIDSKNLENILINFNSLATIIDQLKINKTTLLETKNISLTEALSLYNDKTKELAINKTQLEQDKNNLEKEIIKLNSITDICPTCGQKIPGVIKVDTSDKVQLVETLSSKILQLSSEMVSFKEDYDKKIFEINSEYTLKQNALEQEIQKNNIEYNKLNIDINALNKEIHDNELKLVQLQTEKANRENYKEEIRQRIITLNNLISNINEQIKEEEIKLDTNKQHVDVLNQINTLVKRDFRGYLLSDIIRFIDFKVKEYSKYIFGSDDLHFVLDGNSIDISYSNKLYESLSGGEKQKVDLCIQFALRDMLQQYAKFSCNILVLDEIFDNLDSLGTSNVINLLNTKFDDIESIFIISHHCDELDISYDNEIVIQKNALGISEIL